MAIVNVNNQDFEFYTWEDLGQDILDLGHQINGTEQKFDRLIALAKGGLTFARSLTDLLNIKKLSSIQIEFYSGIDERGATPVIIQSLPVSIKNEHILLFDDIVDHGDTMAMAVNYLNYHGAASITTCSLITKPHTKFKPDFSAQETTAWVIFPNEVRETIELLTQNWQKAGYNNQEITTHLENIGLPKREVALFGPKQ